MARRMELAPDILRTFVAAAQTLNFTQAAKQVNRTQSAVSLQIRKLEKDIGKSLFRRESRGVELTGDGKALLKHARRLLRLHDEVIASITEPDLEGLVRLGAPDDYASQHLHGILRRFALKYPLVRVDLFCDLSDDLFKMLQRNELDLCLCNRESIAQGGQFLRNEPIVWIGPTDAEPEKESPLPLSVFHHGCIYRKWAMQTLEKQGIAYRVAYSSPSIAGVLAAVKLGFAVAPVGASTPISEFRLLPDGVLPKLPSAVVTLHQSAKDSPANEVQTCLAKYIIEEFQAMPFIAARPRLVK